MCVKITKALILLTSDDIAKGNTITFLQMAKIIDQSLNNTSAQIVFKLGNFCLYSIAYTYC